METTHEVTAKRYACRHIHLTGRRCDSPALRGEQFCYYHHATRPPAPATPRPILAPDAAFDMPSLEDRPSIHLALTEIVRRIAANQLDTRRAGLLLYSLQIASANLPREPRAQRAASRYDQPNPEESSFVEDFQVDPTHGPLAPIAELDPPEEDDDFYGVSTPLRSAMRSILRDRCPTCKAAKATWPRNPDPDPEPTPYIGQKILPKIQAVAQGAEEPGGLPLGALELVQKTRQVCAGLLLLLLLR